MISPMDLQISSSEHGLGTMEDGLDKTIEKFLRKYPNTCLIVIDTFQMVRGSSKEPTYGGDYADAQKLKRIADKGVPAVSFARIAPPSTATIHNSYDTVAVMKGEQMVGDIDFLIAFTDRMVNAVRCPVAKTMPDNMKDKLDEYLCRKRPNKK